MKKIIFILLSFFFVQNLLAQETRMWVGKKDGKVLSYPIDSIEKVAIEKKSSPQNYYAIDIFTLRQIPYDYKISPFTTSEIVDSIFFRMDTLMLNAGMSDKFSLKGPQKIDSITFSSYELDTNILVLSDMVWDCKHHAITGVDLFAQWIGDRIYKTSPFGYVEIDTGFNIIRDSTYCPTLYTGRYISIDKSGKKSLTIRSRITIATSLGFLFEYDYTNGEEKLLLKNIDSNVSSAEYFNDDSILYYSFGPSYSQTNQTPVDAGYYLYDRKTGKSSLVLRYLSEIGQDEMVNGFDISPDRKKILIPVNRYANVPYIIEYNIPSGSKDTLPVSFEPFDGNQRSLWLRYSHDGKKILYDLYPIGTFGSAFGVFYGSETGIIDRDAFSKKIINTNPTSEGIWVTVFPSWSSDDKHIVYLAGSISNEPPGSLAIGSIYILKKF